jgi:hypothetical protein
MPTHDRTHYGFKQITPDNWLTPDLTKTFPLLTAEVWVPELLKPQLDEKVPKDIRSLFECARAMYIYGYLFYPMITMANEQLHRVAEAAAAAKCKALGPPAQKPGKPAKKPQHLMFWDSIQRLVTAGIISAMDEPWWQRTRTRRNAGSHPDSQAIHAPGVLLGSFIEATDHINKLFLCQSDGHGGLLTNMNPGFTLPSPFHHEYTCAPR